MTVYDRVIPNHAMSSLTALTIGSVIVILFDFALRILRAYFVDMAGADIDHDIGGSVFERLMAIRLDLKRGSVGALAGLMRELETLRDFRSEEHTSELQSLLRLSYSVFCFTKININNAPTYHLPFLVCT